MSLNHPKSCPTASLALFRVEKERQKWGGQCPIRTLVVPPYRLIDSAALFTLHEVRHLFMLFCFVFVSCCFCFLFCSASFLCCFMCVFRTLCPQPNEFQNVLHAFFFFYIFCASFWRYERSSSWACDWFYLFSKVFFFVFCVYLSSPFFSVQSGGTAGIVGLGRSDRATSEQQQLGQ